MPSEEPRTRIKQIGLEVEGGWRSQPPDLHHDGSVRGLPADMVVGELSSSPITGLANAEAWLRERYPHATNESCGFHVHLSFNELNYSRLMDEDFNNFFLAEMERFWLENRSKPGFDLFRFRLDGQNQYCQKIFRPELQLWRQEAYGDRGTHPRYSQLNFCYGRHGTMECRLFPCFSDVADSVEALRVFHNCCETYLQRCQPEKPITHVITARKAYV